MSLKKRIVSTLQKQPLTSGELKRLFGSGKKVSVALKELRQRKKIVKNDNVYYVAQRAKTSSGTSAVIVKHAGHFAFAKPDVGDKDFFIGKKHLGGALLGDKVLLRVITRGDRPEAAVVGIITPTQTATGIVAQCGERYAALLDGYGERLEVLIKRSDDSGATVGERVAVELSRHDNYDDMRCVVQKRFGECDTALSAAKALLYGAGLRQHFPVAVKEEAESLLALQTLPQPDDERLDLRDMLIFTIDGADTKDIDDAISLERTQQGWSLGVHIADVSHYVKSESALMSEAALRGFSFYYPGNVIPMLPFELSNGLCSLNPGVDRLCFSCILELSPQGELITSSFVKTVIRSAFQGVYSEVDEVLNDTASPNIMQKYAAALPTLKEMKTLADILKSRRVNGGSVEFDLPETGYVLSEHGMVEDVYKKQRLVSSDIIEEFMLAANCAVAQVAREVRLPILYRVHDLPSQEKLYDLKTLLSRVSDSAPQFNPAHLTGKEMSQLLDRYKDSDLYGFVNRSLLRSMAKAEYSTSPLGHYGLSFKDYCHFTSPIRRYSDLVTHHVLAHFSRHHDAKQTRMLFEEAAQQGAVAVNAQEILFLRTERDIRDRFTAEGMKKHIGDTFDGIISGVTENGVFVTLPNTAEGRIHIADLCEDYLLYEEGYCLHNQNNTLLYRIGDGIKVRVVSADSAGGRIDLCPEGFQI